MKKIICILLSTALLLALAGCGAFLTEDESERHDYRADETARREESGEADTSEPDEIPTTASEPEADEPAVSETVTEETKPAVPAVIPTRLPGDPMTVCIDAGHGYNDPGCTGENIGDADERQINEEVAQLLRRELEAAGHRVIMLHSPDKAVTVDEITSAADALGMTYLAEKLEDSERFAPYNRVVWANVLHRSTYIDIFVSIHIDNLPEDDSVNGTRLYYCSDTFNADLTGALCSSVADSLNSEPGDTSVKVFAYPWDDAYAVTKRTDMPSFLIELGFISNKTDAENIMSDEWRHTLVGGMVKGFEDYFASQY